MSSPSDSSPRYGDYPELFWDLQPDVVIDMENPVIIARVLQEGSLRHIRELLPMELLRKHLPDLVIPDNVRLFWTRVLELRSERTRSTDETAR